MPVSSELKRHVPTVQKWYSRHHQHEQKSDTKLHAYSAFENVCTCTDGEHDHVASCTLFQLMRLNVQLRVLICNQLHGRVW